MVAQRPQSQTQPTITWEALPEHYALPDDPVENIQQPWLAAALTDALGAANTLEPQMLTGSNFALVATINNRVIVKAPDWFYVPRVNPVAAGVVRRSYTPHLEGDSVAIVMEFLSDADNNELSVRATPPYGKLYFYEQILQVPTYVIYDPYAQDLVVRQLTQGRYQVQTPDPQGRYWIPGLELNLGIWQGERLGQTLAWLRWWDEAGNLLLWSSEQTEQERQKVQLEAQRADQERERAELALQQAEQEQQKAERLAAKLRELGIDPEAL